jgi:hypothetical protein
MALRDLWNEKGWIGLTVLMTEPVALGICTSFCLEGTKWDIGMELERNGSFPMMILIGLGTTLLVYAVEAMDGLGGLLHAFREIRWLRYDFMIESCVVHGILMKGVLCI